VTLQSSPLTLSPTDTNVIVKGKLTLPHDGRLPSTVLGDLSTYGVKLDAKTGSLTWVQFKIVAGGHQQIAVPLCLDERHGTTVGVFLNVTGSDHTNFDLFFHTGHNSINTRVSA